MPQSLAINFVHLVYSTRERVAYLVPEIRPKLYAYQAGILKEWESPALAIGGDSEHVHTLFALSKNHALCRIVEEVKKGASKWLKTQGRTFSSFYWQSGYGAFSVSRSHVRRVRQYVESQEEHHRTRSFQEEYLLLLKRHGIDYDERYIWD